MDTIPIAVNTTVDAAKTTPDPFHRKNGSANPLEQFAWHAYYIDAPLVRFYDDNTDGAGIVEHYYGHDAQFNVTVVHDVSANVVERYTYTPYGELVIMNASWSTISTSAIANAYTYTGREHDAETGLFNFRNRYYHAQLGRFVNRDPIGYVDGLSFYNAYFAPNDVDPLGLMEGLYVIPLPDGEVYIGETNNIDRRLGEHASDLQSNKDGKADRWGTNTFDNDDVFVMEVQGGYQKRRQYEALVLEYFRDQGYKLPGNRRPQRANLPDMPKEERRALAGSIVDNMIDNKTRKALEGTSKMIPDEVITKVKKNPSLRGPFSAALGGLGGLSLLVEGATAAQVEALNSFCATDQCGHWYKTAANALLAAQRGDGSQCGKIAGGRLFTECHASIGLGSYTKQVAGSYFEAYAQYLARACSEAARRTQEVLE